jgi:hypothetical protein
MKTRPSMFDLASPDRRRREGFSETNETGRCIPVETPCPHC